MILNKLQKTILVTGGAGFIGSHLCDKLLELDADVVCFDNLFTGKEENIIHNKINPSFVFVKGDVNKYAELEKIFINYKIDYVFHLAAVIGVKRVEENPLLVLSDIAGIENILKLSKKYAVKKVIFSSSSEAYGDTNEMPLSEDTNHEIKNNQKKQLHLYALVKLMGERMMKVYSDKYDLPTCSLRFFNVFGPRQESSAYGFVISVFIKQILNNESPTIFGDGYQTRDFVYIDDVVKLAIKALLSLKTNGEVINIGVGRQTTILDLAERLIHISSKNLKLKFLSSRKNEIRYRSPDVKKMHKYLGVLKDKLDKNLALTYEWYNKQK